MPALEPREHAPALAGMSAVCGVFGVVGLISAIASGDTLVGFLALCLGACLCLAACGLLALAVAAWRD